MVKKKKQETVESIKEESVKVEPVSVVEEVQKYQRPDPVVPIEDAVAKDAPIYENLPKE